MSGSIEFAQDPAALGSMTTSRPPGHGPVRAYDWLDHHAANRAAKQAVRDLGTGRSFTYGDLDRRADSMAAYLASIGVGRGDRVALLAHNGVETEIVYPACCGMPALEHGDIAQVAEQARKVSGELKSWIDKGYDVIALTASCGLMMKFEWPLILPDDEDVRALAAATRDISEYIVDIAKNEGLVEGMKSIDGGITVHMACHARAQNMGAKSAEMLRRIPDAKVDIVERCSGHGGTFGVMKETRPLAVKVAKPAVGQIKRKGNRVLCSDCPLACKHLEQELTADAEATEVQSAHPIEIMAEAYGL